MNPLQVIGSIPSPGSNAIHLGALQLRAYGLFIAAGWLVAVRFAQGRWAGRGGNPDDVNWLATWSVTAGLVGARAYHVLTDYRRFEGRWLHVFAVWEGGLGIPGGLLVGVVTGAVLACRRGLPAAELLDVVAPAIPVAQAIGRIGNWFNQELFGRPSGLPWAVRIDREHRPVGYEQVATFHPAFAYEALWNLALAGLLVLYERRRPQGRPGRLFAVYVAGYGLGRLWVEALRIDEATTIAGVRVNIWVSLLAVVGAAVWLTTHRNDPNVDPTDRGKDDRTGRLVLGRARPHQGAPGRPSSSTHHRACSPSPRPPKTFSRQPFRGVMRFRPRTEQGELHTMRSRTQALTAITLALALGGAACGSTDDTTNAGSGDTTGGSERTVEVEMRDNTYSPDSVAVEAGETIKFVFTNNGEATHDAFVGDAQAQDDHEEEMDDEMGGHDMGGDEEAITVEPGDTGELTHTFKADDEVLIGCHEPGHYKAGMRITVEMT